ncbi:TetR family transcriptional regulator [Flexivirga endophytica]|uniref:TetR family transcriptional regulator n=1 Tax=Flexivirga endophytica TaxID=1849103 RepID=A0A916WS50_9MICO|nr:TetR/AcrR family transcriptional regulator [Flexivirga endophytica]GGB24755.1 TetR family transcriptional regulator [Flexivirga endophytica]GHB63469.1 TetR family transcriptional regulator [Flexivirga endophytica]
MARWQPGARERLQATALQLFADHGFEQTTVAQIAHAAELTERTFFRHFADKREVLFAGQEDFLDLFTDPIDEAPAGTPAYELIRRSLDGAGGFFPDERRPFARVRASIIGTEPALQERELAKLAALKVRLGELFRERAIEEPAATLAAEAGVTIFHLSFQQWIAEGEQRSMSEIARERLDAMAALVSA